MQEKQPTKRKSSHSQIVNDLGRKIASGAISPEEKLPHESELCADYAVSRPVLREAIRVLSAKGLVVSKPGIGAVVRARDDWHQLDPDVLNWVFQTTPRRKFLKTLEGVRRTLEPEIASLAAMEATDEDIASIEEAFARMACAKTPEEMLQPDVDFHLRIAKAAKNDVLGYLYRMLSDALQESINASNKSQLFQPFALSRHKAILTAIKERDGLAARHASIVQLNDARTAIDDVLNTSMSPNATDR